MAKNVTMQDIADALGVTKVSVSKALNNQPGVGDDLRKRVLETAQVMGYQKSVKRMYAFAFICAKRFFLDDEMVYTSIYYYLNKHCAKIDSVLSCFIISPQEELTEDLPSQLKHGDFDGIFIGGEFSAQYLRTLAQLDGVKIGLDFYTMNPAFDSIVVDNYYASQIATNYLIEKGHRDIGFIGDIFANASISDRYFGVLKTLTLNGLAMRPECCFSVIDRVSGQATEHIQLPSSLPTAFICHCDKAAFILMQLLERSGVRIPEETSFIGFDDTRLSELVTPRLTSVSIDRVQLAALGMKQMLNKLQFGEGQGQRKRYLEAKLVERDSVADLRK